MHIDLAFDLRVYDWPINGASVSRRTRANPCIRVPAPKSPWLDELHRILAPDGKLSMRSRRTTTIPPIVTLSYYRVKFRPGRPSTIGLPDGNLIIALAGLRETLLRPDDSKWREMIYRPRNERSCDIYPVKARGRNERCILDSNPSYRYEFTQSLSSSILQDDGSDLFYRWSVSATKSRARRTPPES